MSSCSLVVKDHLNMTLGRDWNPAIITRSVTSYSCSYATYSNHH